MPQVLIIDDHPAVGEALSLLLSLHDIEASVAASPAEGLALLETRPFGLVIQDMNFTADTTSGEEGRRLFLDIRQRWPQVPIILLTAWTELASAVELVKGGAADYLAKPWDDRKLLTTVSNLLALGASQRALHEQQQARQLEVQALHQRWRLGYLVLASGAMVRTVDLACRVAASEVPVLITGPNGCGKERIAELIHANSRVAAGPMVAVNCGALPADLIEAELFGAEAGAYTGAHKARAGRFEAADGGTLFLDEIGNLPLSGQVKLLRVLETGRFERLGSPLTRQAKVRVVSATNADLASMVRQGLFREDLLYRLQGIELKVPPLSERLDDLRPLAQQVLAQHGRAWDDLSASARQALMAHAWPGNVRELRHTMARACVLAGDAPIDVTHLALPPATATGTPPSALAQASSSPPSRWPAFDTAQGMSPRDPENHRNLDEPPRERIIQAMTAAQGVVSRAASALGLSRQALYRRLEHFGLSEAAARPPRDPGQPA